MDTLRDMRWLLLQRPFFRTIAEDSFFYVRGRAKLILASLTAASAPSSMTTVRCAFSFLVAFTSVFTEPLANDCRKATSRREFSALERKPKRLAINRSRYLRPASSPFEKAGSPKVLALPPWALRMESSRLLTGVLVLRRKRPMRKPEPPPASRKGMSS